MLYVSIQPTHNKQLWYDKEFILSMAKSVTEGGASGLKIEGVENILHLSFNRSRYCPIIGIIKKKSDMFSRYITPTMTEIRQLQMILNKPFDLIEVDMTLRDGFSNVYARFFTDTKDQLPLIAAISTFEEAEHAIECGAKWISTTLRGYTDYTKHIQLPDLHFIKELSKLNCNVIAEGGYSTHSQYKKALQYNARIVCIGSAITRPDIITERILHGTP